MMKFLCIFAMAIAVCHAGDYAKYEKPVVGGYQYQVQPAVTVQYLVPSYGNYAHGSYPANKYYAPAPVPAYNKVAPHSYNVGVDYDALKLAHLALAAPSAGAPIQFPKYEKYDGKYNYAPAHYGPAPAHYAPAPAPAHYAPAPAHYAPAPAPAHYSYGPVKATGASASIAASAAGVPSKPDYKPKY